ncbi:MAG: hypothetical protein C0511_06905 [Hyphomicrobium sp.]|nr:hypothetical protein [Hyphomicrobium sp.]
MYQFRVKVPVDPRDALGREHVNRSLRKDSRSLAIMLNKAEAWGYRLENTNPCRSVRPNTRRQCERFFVG